MSGLIKRSAIVHDLTYEKYFDDISRGKIDSLWQGFEFTGGNLISRRKIDLFVSCDL